MKALTRKDQSRSAEPGARDKLEVLCGRARLGAMVAWAVFAWGWQIAHGIGVSGKRRPEFWSLYITSFVFWIGISHAGTLISAILRVTNASWRRPVTRCAEAITVFALLDRFDVSDSFIWGGSGSFTGCSVSERTNVMAQLPLATDLGFLRDQCLPHRKSDLPLICR